MTSSRIGERLLAAMDDDSEIVVGTPTGPVNANTCPHLDFDTNGNGAATTTRSRSGTGTTRSTGRCSRRRSTSSLWKNEPGSWAHDTLDARQLMFDSIDDSANGELHRGDRLLS